LLATPEILTDIDSNVASQVQKLGYITLNENGIERKIAVFEVTLAHGIILERNRVGLRNLLRKYWKDIDAAFIAYHRPESPKWRFTYVSELTGYDADGKFVINKTEPKRYTYLLGEGESTRTAAERFTAIANKGSKATLDDLKEAFSVEKLSKAFFDETKTKSKFKTYFEGKYMGYWLVNSISYLDYQPETMYNAMFPELFENEKLVGLRTLSDITKLRFIYYNQGYYCNDSVAVVTLWYKLKNAEYTTIKRTITKENIATSKNYSYQYLQAILNCKLIKFHVNELMYDGTHFYPNHMKVLPIKISELKNQSQFIKLADKIHSLILENKATKNLEQQIDNLVYKLYELSYDEVKVIDPKFGLTEQEYEAIVLE